MPVEIFQPVAVTAPHPRFERRAHPMPPKSTTFPANRTELTSPPIQTNKFYSNLYLGDQGQGVFMIPYVLWWERKDDNCGLSVSQTNIERRVAGTPGQDKPDPSKPSQFYFHPVGERNISLSAFEFDKSMKLELTDFTQFSVTATFSAGPAHGTNKALQVPLVLGSAFITGIYFNLTPRFSTIHAISGFALKQSPRPNMQKYQLDLNNGTHWLIYAIIQPDEKFALKKEGNTIIAEQRSKMVIIQVCRLVRNSEKVYDDHAGKYAVRAQISGTANGREGTIHINWSTRQSNNKNNLLLFALPHHVASFDSQTKNRACGFGLDGLTKGRMMAFSTNDFYMKEALPTYIGFQPWTSIPDLKDKIGHYTNEALNAIFQAACDELNQDVVAQTNLNSMYFSGKALDKFAYIAYVAFEILKNQEMTRAALSKAANAFHTFVANRQQLPLVYDTTYKGLVSRGAFDNGNVLEDFGNSYYNDHHFHYGYFIHAAALIGYIDSALGGSWVYDNRDYVNLLVRDIGNPSDSDPYFPVSRSFDWFHGHSWAKGLFESADGKDQESTSEDYHHAYGIKLWGKVTGDKSMEARGDMMLAIMRRSFQTYFLFTSDNKVQDPHVLGNKVTGILFENKIDHTTYFSPRIECIQGIHMLPITPVSSYIRSPKFTKEEWDALIKPIVDKVEDGWRGVLYADMALFDPRTAYNFFADSRFKMQWLDGGASRTWYLTYTAGVGGCS
ncbi:endo-1,3(4)-beta-glucanase [Lipomyces oligophaga]|uniref:endo-1,3(4)-beta-glucanase n=1 Tax=Lipomyces oligophaga TaxID=45792 RepID=UPI0034CE4F76